MKNKIILSLLVVVLIGLLAGCENTIKPSQCSFCGGKIYWDNSNNSAFQGQHQQQMMKTGDKNYHVWCVKTMKLEIRVMKLEGGVDSVQTRDIKNGKDNYDSL